jgi:hypothetical protein
MGHEDTPAVVERWDQFMRQLSAQPRRQIIVSLMEAPRDSALPLPEAAVGDAETAALDGDGVERWTTILQHRHLPALAEAGYVRWSRDPFRVRRGPRFEEPAAVMRVLLSAEDRLPSTLVSGCVAES